MRKGTHYILQSLFLFHVLLAFLLIFESKIKIPFWIQPLGRMHPLILHFPVAFIALLVLFSFAKKNIEKKVYKKLHYYLLVITAFTTTIATLMGFLLSLEGYESNLMKLHKWFGISLSFYLYGLVYVFSKNIYRPLLYFGFFLVIIVGHYGAGLTHGSNFITEPLDVLEEVAENQSVYHQHIQPILNSKCKSCHNGDKAKGGLDMSSIQSIKKGGKHGNLWIANQPENSLFLKRVLLPLQHKEHMSPEGKPQLTKKEIELITEWIRNGINDTVQYLALEDKATLKKIIDQKFLKSSSESTYKFDFTEEKVLSKLKSSPYISIEQESIESPALIATILSGGPFNPKDLKSLLTVKEQLISLNLSNLSVTDNDLIIIKEFKNLEHLWLNFTKITTKGIKELKELRKLKTFSAVGTKIDNESISNLKLFSNLEKLCIWDTKINREGIDSLLTRFPDLNLEKGIAETDAKSILTPPKTVHKGNVKKDGDLIFLKHRDDDITIRYSINNTVHKNSSIYKEGIVIDFKDKKTIEIVARAFKTDKKPSSVLKFKVFKQGIKPNSIETRYPNFAADYFGDGTQLLIDDFLPLKFAKAYGWSKYTHAKRFEAIVDFKEINVKLKELDIKCATLDKYKHNNLEYAEIYGSDTKENWKLLNKISYSKKEVFDRKYSINFNLKNRNYNYYKIIVQPTLYKMFFTSQLLFY